MPNRILARNLSREVARQADLHASLWDRYAAEDIAPEAPHRQRTATNRLLGYALFLGATHRDTSPLGRSLAGLREWQRAIGPLRDGDVMRGWVEKLGAAAGEGALPAVAAFQEDLAATRATIAARVRADAVGYPGARARSAMLAARMHLGYEIEDLRERGSAFSRAASLAIVAGPWRAQLAVLATTQADAELHSFRVRNKRLRFVLDVLAEEEHDRLESGDGPIQECARVAARIHEALGALQDLHVLRDTLRLARARWQEAGRGIDAAAALLERARVAAEEAPLSDWYALWPRLRVPGFLDLFPPDATGATPP